MKRFPGILYFLGALLAGGTLSQALTIPASEDTTIAGRTIQLAASNATSLMVDPTHVPLIYFNLDDIPKDTVVRFARLRLYTPSVKDRGAGIGVHRVTGQWNEAAESAQPSFLTAPIARIDGPKLGSRRFVTVDVTGLVQSWIKLQVTNEGFALTSLATGNRNVAPTSATIAAKEGAGLGLPAQLDIELAANGSGGAQGPAGPQGVKGETGATGPQGLQGLRGLQGIQGPKGDTGAAGPQGPAGVNGRTILSGTVAPATGTGVVGDFYLNTTTTALYGPKTTSGWGTPKSLAGSGNSGAASGGSLTMVQMPGDVTTLVSYFKPSVSVVYDPASGALQPTASGVGTLSYQWLRNNIEVANATSLQLTGANLASGSYALRVSNGVFSAVSSVVYCSADMLGMANVQGGTLPEGSEVAGQSVSDFLIGKYEVTWAEWKTVRDWAVTHGYSDLADVGAGNGDNYPVTNVNWYDAVKWCNARSEMEGVLPVYVSNDQVVRSGQVVPDVRTFANGYRLPTVAEWEWAARGGRQTNGQAFSGSNDSNLVAWTSENSSGTVHESGTLAPNQLGLFDMSGNVWEWCFSSSVLSGGSGRERGDRGGSFRNPPSQADVTVQGVSNPEQNLEDHQGFRVVLGLPMARVLGGNLPSESSLAGQVVGDFQIGRTEVTWSEWKAVRDWAVSYGYSDLAAVGAGSGDNYPVMDVSWYDVVKWCNARSEMEGKTPVYQVGGATYKTGQSTPTLKTSANGYRLPTEAEWEWAARGGKQSRGYTYSGSDDLNEVGWYVSNAEAAPHETGTKVANELGLSDMSGNVWEWCEGLYSATESALRVLRGGAWGNCGPDYCAVAFRLSFNQEFRSSYCGFRVAFRLVP
jgi:formylglycine-generating enzyme required for sulfatase activity